MDGWIAGLEEQRRKGLGLRGFHEAYIYQVDIAPDARWQQALVCTLRPVRAEVLRSLSLGFLSRVRRPREDVGAAQIHVSQFLQPPMRL